MDSVTLIKSLDLSKSEFLSLFSGDKNCITSYHCHKGELQIVSVLIIAIIMIDYMSPTKDCSQNSSQHSQHVINIFWRNLFIL